ncbi:PAS domain S-box protein [Adhaeribacter swui]|uniref:PAS domain S-box protein n=1 Tax=Adhaeribacter swui TaxID=2086471 RepID=A0A7G7GCF3_9BACT|nr:PAS domain S-box protein [Adhaeribacter swui]QNF34837.1 PAS domain S-box protein [Adhaeribacter swui]
MDKERNEMESSKASEFITEKPQGFLITGIGASAGGIQALQEFFQHVPAGSGVAYVVILHLSPDHDSKLAQVIQSVTTIPVTQVKEKTKIQPDHIFVVPPNQHLILEDGFIAPSVNLFVEERRAPVDIFFRSLADTHGPRAISVVLSGTGANGSMGLKRVKERGGAVYVQNPREAEFNEMPRNAIATELVDEVLPVAEIPARIMAYRESIGTVEIVAESATRPEQQQQALREIFTQLRVRTGHDFSNYKRPTLLRRIERRINIHNLPDLPSYAAFVHQHLDEANALLKDLLISVTNFFRDKKSFEALEREILPAILKNRSAKDEIRVWVAGCATGEEAYTLAMLLAERTQSVIDAPKVQIFGTDIDEAALAVAREGLYTLNDAADVSPDRLRQFFNKEGDNYRIKREIREMVLFANHNFLKDPPFSRLDLVTCRNVLIYLNETAKERVMETFHFALRPGGVLFLGSSESVEGASDLYAIISREHHIYQKREVSMRNFPVPESVPNFQLREQPLGKLNDPDNRSVNRISFGELHQKMLEQYAPPSLVVNEDYEIMHLSEKVGSYLEFSGGEPTKNLLKLIKPELRLELRSALYQAVQRQTPIEARNIPFSNNGERQFINLLVRPVTKEGESVKGFILIIFEPSQHTPSDESIIISADEPVARHLEEELIQVKAQLRSAAEQYEYQAEELKASNEELQAMNEELRSAAEELETSKEELQSINEELRTVNQELKVKIEETSVTSNNLQNLINSADVATIFLDRAFCIRLYTPAARQIFNLIPSDYGRPLSDITHRLEYGNLLTDTETVLDKLTVLEREVTTTDHRTFMMRVLPYRTTEDRINGVVITFYDITQRQHAEKALQQSEERLRLLIESAKDYAIYTLDADRKVISWSSGAQLIFGYTEAEILGQSGDIVFVPEDRENKAPEKEAEKAQKEGRAENERWHLRKNNSRFWGSGLTHPLRDDQGNTIGFVKIMRDLTEQRQMEEALRQAEEKYRTQLEQEVEARTAELSESKDLLQATMDATLNMIQVFEAVRNAEGEIIDFRYVLLNNEAERYMPDALGKSLLQIQPGVVEEGIFAAFKEVTETGIPQQYEKHYVHEQFNGWFHQSAVKLGDGVATTTADITQRKIAEQEIIRLKDELARKATDKYQALFNSIDEGFTIIELLYDEEGKLVDFIYQETNPALPMHVGMDVQGKRRSELFLDKKDFLLEKYEHLAKTGEPLHFEYSIDGLGGQWFQVTAARIGGEGSKNLGVLFRNITERKQREQQQSYLIKLGDALRPLSGALEIQDAAMRVLGEQLQVDRVLYAEVDDDGETYSISANYVRGAYPKLLGRFPTSNFGAASKGLRSGEAFAIENMTSEERLSEKERAAFIAHDVYASIGVPLIKAGRWVANLGIQHGQARQWTAEDIALVKETAERTWAAVERAKAENALRKSEEKYRTLFETIEEGFCIMEMVRDEQGDVVDVIFREVNKAFERHTGLANVVGKRSTELIPNQDPNRFKDYQQLSETGETTLSEIYIHDVNRWLRLYRFRMGEPGSNLLAAVFEDITERKQREQHQQFLLNLSDKLRDANSLKDVQTTVTDSLRKHYDAGWCYYVEWDEEKNSSFVQYDSKRDDLLSLAGTHDVSDIPEFLDLLKSGHILNVSDYENYELLSPTIRERYTAAGFRSMLVASLVRQGSLISSLIIGDTKIRNWSTYDEALLAEVAERTWAAIERAKAEDALRRADERYRTMTDNAPVLIWETDESGGTFANRYYTDFFGVSLEEILAMGWTKFLHPEDAEGYFAAYQKAFEEREPYSYECRFLRADGEYRWLLNTGHPLGENRFVGFSVDITERNRAEQALRNSEERLQLAVDTARTVVWEWDVAENRIETTPNFSEVYGLSVIEFTQQGFALLHPDDQEAHLQKVQKASKEGGGYYSMFRIVRPDTKETIWFEERADSLTGEDGQVIKLVGASIDITDIKKAEKALQKSEEKYRTLFNSMDEGYCIIQMLYNEENEPYNWIFLEVNPAFEKNNGLSNATGKTILELTPNIEPKWFEIYGRVATTGQPNRFEEDSPALNRWFSLYAFRVGIPEERKVAVLFNDITQRKNAEAALIKSEEQFRRAIQDAPIPIIMHAEDGKVLQISRTWTELTGYQPEEVPTFDHWLTHAYGEGANMVRQHMQQLFKNDKESLNIDFPIKTRVKGLRYWSFSASSPGRLADGRRFIVGMALDITERIASEEKLQDFNKMLEKQVTDRTQALRESRDMLQSVFDTTLLSLSILKAVRDENGEIIDFEIRLINKELERETGRTDLVGKLYSVEYPGIKQAGLFDLMLRVVETGEPGQVEYYYPHENFNKWYAAMFVKMDDGLVASNLDITERKLAEAELSRNFTILKQAEEVAGIGSWEYDYNTHNFYWSEGMYHLFGLPVGSKKSLDTYLEYVIEEDRHIAEKLVNSIKQEPQPLEEIIRVRVNGQLVSLKIKAIVLHDDLNRPYKMLGVDLDVSVIKHLEQENLEMRLEQQKALLLAILDAQQEERRRISESLHNGVGQLLYATKLNLNQLADQIPKEVLSPTAKLLTEAIQETRRVSHELVPMVLQDFGLTRALQELCRSYEQSSIEVNCDVDLEGRLESYLELAIYRIAQELLTNVAKHAQATRADLLLEQEEGNIMLKVRDNGKGINLKNGKPKGIGLRTIGDRVNLLNGTFTVSTPASGKGTLVVIQLPNAG